nr:MAG TPA: hypothetical protein [Caudoviricetes sp.]
MTHKLYDVSMEQVMAEHYLFDLGYPVAKVSEILDMDEAYVRDVYEARTRLTIPQRSDK